MAGQGDLLSELQRQLRLLDDAALTALASSGLLRRARKDLEGCSPSWTLEADAVKVDLGAHQILLDRRGAAHARCTCPAKTTCQHVLAAILFVADLSLSSTAETRPAEPASSAGPPSSLHDDLMAIGIAGLITFAGKAAVREALRIVTDGGPREIAMDKAIVIRLQHPAVELRYAGGGLDAFITDNRGRQRKRLIAAAVIAYQMAHGRSTPAIPGEAPRRPEDDHAVTPEVAQLRETLLPKIAQLLCDAVESGLAHLSDNFVERFLSLATVAEGARLHRLSLALTRHADAIDLQLERHVQADSDQLLEAIARTFALTTALQSRTTWSRLDLVGEARSAYEETASLDLFCAGAFPWRTASGYAGLTLLFWSPGERRWLSFAESRPVGTIGFDPKTRYRTRGPWQGCDSPAAIAGKRVQLTGASLNRLGRLSSAAATRAVVSASTELPDFHPVAARNWSLLADRLRATTDGFGLAEDNPHRNYVVLLPTRYGSQSFDPTNQQFIWPLIDETGAPLLLRLPYTEVSAHAIERLEDGSPGDIVGIVGQVELSRFARSVRPLTLLTKRAERRVDCIFLDEAPKKSIVASLTSKLRGALTAAIPRFDGEEPLGASATDGLLNALSTDLLKVAERGTAADPSQIELIDQRIAKLAQAGLTIERPGRHDRGARRVLELRYCVETARQLLANS